MLLPPCHLPPPPDGPGHQGRGGQKGRKRVPCLFKRVWCPLRLSPSPTATGSRWGGLEWSIYKGNKGPLLPGS